MEDITRNEFFYETSDIITGLDTEVKKQLGNTLKTAMLN